MAFNRATPETSSWACASAGARCGLPPPAHRPLGRSRPAAAEPVGKSASLWPETYTYLGADTPRGCACPEPALRPGARSPCTRPRGRLRCGSVALGPAGLAPGGTWAPGCSWTEARDAAAGVFDARGGPPRRTSVPVRNCSSDGHHFKWVLISFEFCSENVDFNQKDSYCSA